MSPLLHGRAGHYLLLSVTWAVLCLVNLGAPSLWDIDEGNNATCAREMYEAGNWIVPTFNFQIRVDKPALLYWMQMLGYHVFGVSEFAARLPSALAALASILLTYELGRRMFSASAGLLAGLILASTVLFCGAAHFANPDVLLTACTLGTLALFWWDFERGGNRWLVLCGITTGLGMLAKGPVGLVLPGVVIGLFLLWSRQLGRAFRPALWGGVLLFILVAIPWYAWVGAETRGVFLRGFFFKHNFGRFLDTMESHGGPVIYYPLILIAGFAPWTMFFLPAGWQLWKDTRERGGDARYRFLGCWIGVYLLFFSFSKTKLPNYILPLYPALALLTAQFLDRWRKGEASVPGWMLHAALVFLVLTGLTTAAGLTVGGNPGAALLRGRHLPGLERWAVVGLVPVLGALAGWWCLRRHRRGEIVLAVGLSAVVWLGVLVGWGEAAVEQRKATRTLGAALQADQPGGDIYIATYAYSQPSLVFYCQRKVQPLGTERDVLDWLAGPLPSYVVLPAALWERLRKRAAGPHRVLARNADLYGGFDVVLVANR